MYKETGVDIGAGEGGGGVFFWRRRDWLGLSIILLWLKKKMEVNPFCIILLLGLTLQEELEYLKTRAISGTVSERELCDINLEFTRINLRFELCLLKHNITKLNLTLMASHSNLLRDVQDELSNGKLIQTERLDELLEMLSGIRWVSDDNFRF